jgi:HK97 family phage prohead protease
MELERRFANLVSVEVRADNGDGPIGFTGHAAVFGQRTAIGDPKRWGFWEQVDRGAFDDIAQDDVRFLINHNPDLVLARSTASTLRLSSDAEGLAVDADLAPTSYGRDLQISLGRRDVTQMSFAFATVADSWETLDDGTELRTLLKVKTYDVSAVTYPAYDATDAGVRSAFDVRRGQGLEPDQIKRLRHDEARSFPTWRDAEMGLLARRCGLRTPA